MPDQTYQTDNGAGSNFQDMMRYQMISQYQQNLTNPQSRMAQYQSNKVMGSENFQYGVGPNQPDNRFFRRQAEMSRFAFSSAVAGTTLTQGAFSLGSAGLEAVGVSGGLVGGFLAPMALSAAPVYFINKGIQNTLARQRVMQSMAADIEQYRDNIGMSNMGYGTATQLGRNLMSSAFQRNQFFNPNQQMDVLKTALSNDMLTSKGRGMASGDMQTFQRNFKELLETTEMVVKTLKTTKEGGLAVIKEMQQQGFGTMGQIQAGIINASAYNRITGLGTQNMLQIGAAGANAVQGTPWSAAAGASMYQTGAAFAGALARGGEAASRTIQMAGGVAQAGSTIAQAQMAALQSGIGSRVVAYAMDEKGKIDTKKLDQLLGGQLTGYQINMGAAATANKFHTAGTMALFERRKGEFLNSLATSNPEYIPRLFQAEFAAWGANRRGGPEEQTQAFATEISKVMGTPNDLRFQNVIADYIRAPKPYGSFDIERRSAMAEARSKIVPENDLHRALRLSERAMFGGLIDFGAKSVVGTSDAIGALQTGYRSLSRQTAWTAGTLVERALSPIIKTGIWKRGNVGNVGEGYRNLYGMDLNVGEADVARYARKSKSYQESLGNISTLDIKKEYGISLEDRMGRLDRDRTEFFIQTLRTGGNKRSQEIFNDPMMLGIMGVQKFSPQWNNIMANPTRAAWNVLTQATKHVETMNKKASDGMATWESYYRDNQGRAADLSYAQSMARGMNFQDRFKYTRMMTLVGPRQKQLSQKEMDIGMAVMAEGSAKMQAKYGGIDTNIPAGTPVDLQTERAMASTQIKSYFGTSSNQRTNKWRSSPFKSILADLGMGLIPIVGVAAYADIATGGRLGAELGTYFKNKKIKNVLGIDKTDPLEQFESVYKTLQGATSEQIAYYQKAGLIRQDIGGVSGTGYAEDMKYMGALYKRTVERYGDAKSRMAAQGITWMGDLKNQSAMNYMMSGGKGGLTKDAKTELSIKYGMPFSEIESLYKIPGALFNKINTANRGEHQADPAAARMAFLDQELARVRSITDVKGIVKYYTSKEGQQIIGANKTAAEASIMAEKMMLLQSSVRPDSNKSIDTVVHAPVLNYWSNRWVM